MGLFKSIVDYIIKASIPTYKFDNNALYFKIKGDNFYTYELENYEIKTRHDPYVVEAYTLTTNDIHLEYIKTDSEVLWNGETLSVYESLLKEKLKINSLETLEEKDIDTYCFKIYKVNNSFIFHIVYLYTATSNLIIIDTKGKLFKDLRLNFDKTYKYKYENEQKGEVNFNISLVKENSLRSYFGL